PTWQAPHDRAIIRAVPHSLTSPRSVDSRQPMNTRDLTLALPALFSELVDGSLDPNAGTSMLNRGDEGLLRSLDKLSPSDASTTHAGGATIAAHVDHLRYGLALLNQWAAGASAPWANADWTLSWQKPRVTDDEWRTLRADFRRECETWSKGLAVARELN